MHYEVIIASTLQLTINHIQVFMLIVKLMVCSTQLYSPMYFGILLSQILHVRDHK